MKDEMFPGCPTWREAAFQHFRARGKLRAGASLADFLKDKTPNLDEVIPLAGLVEACYYTTAMAQQRLLDAVDCVARDVMQPAASALERWVLGLIEQSAEESQRLQECAERVSLVSFGLGIEQGLGYLAGDQSVDCLRATATALAVRAAAPLGILVQIRKMGEDHALERAEEIVQNAHWRLTQAWIAGYEASLGVERRSDEFLKAAQAVLGRPSSAITGPAGLRPAILRPPP